MFDTQFQFYPTPKELAKKMVRPYLYAELSGQRRLMKGLKILDPGAGSGALLESIYDIYIEGQYDLAHSKDKLREYWSQSVFACEIQEDLQHVLIGKGINLIASDFLQLQTPRKFDLIVMNPPFANGAKHILHAWKFLDSGNLVALVNSETINNPCDTHRKLLAKLIEDNQGTVEDAGQVFRDAERRAKVNVSIIRLTKEDRLGFALFDDEDFTRSTLSDPIIGDLKGPESELAKRDVIGNLILRYQEAVDHFLTYKQSERKMKLLENNFDWPDSTIRAAYRKGDYYTAQELEKRKKDDKKTFDNYLSHLTAAAWRTVIRLTGFKDRMTSRVRNEFEKNIEGVQAMEFTRDNIVKLLDLLVQSHTQIIEQCILDAYDELTKYHKKNRVHVEGWKSNDAYKVKKKVIIPYAVEYWDSGVWYLTERTRGGILADLDKAMCFLAGRRIEDVDTIEEAVREKARNNRETRTIGSDDTYCESTFFKMRFFMKGTIHLTFKDLKLHDRFNLFVAQKRGWLADYEAEGVTDLVRHNVAPTT